jgi:hypothetical protein
MVILSTFFIFYFIYYNKKKYFISDLTIKELLKEFDKSKENYLV